jgi:4-hydroxy-tetrahydrodipicolinate synthase
MKLTRQFCKKEFKIFSGDDALVYDMITDPDIKASGSISVMSNIAPKFMTKMVSLLNKGDTDGAMEIQTALKPLLDIVVVTTLEASKFGQVSCRARNPLPLKTMMQMLGMPGGPCRKPLGKMTNKGFNVVLHALKMVQFKNPEIFEPIASFFNVNIQDRLDKLNLHKNLYYKEY